MLISSTPPSSGNTLEHLAKSLGVSKATVSLVLNGKGRIGSETRHRVEQALQQMNYRPRVIRRRAAATLRRRLGHIGIVCPVSPLDVGRNDTLNGWILSAQQEIRRLGGSVSLFVGSRRVHEDHLFEAILRRGEMDGLLLMGVGDDDGYLQAVRSWERPVVVVNRRPEREEFSYVAWDDLGAGEDVAEYLLNLGHRRLGVVYNDAPGRIFHRRRCDGFVAALTKRGLEPVLVRASQDFSDPANEALIGNLRAAGATAVFATNDVRAVGLIDACERLGVAVPAGLSIVGFDNTEQRSGGGLRPTSAGCTERNIAVTAVKLMNQLLDPDRKVRFLASVLSVDVVVHDTSAPALEPSESRPGTGRRRAASAIVSVT